MQLRHLKFIRETEKIPLTPAAQINPIHAESATKKRNDPNVSPFALLQEGTETNNVLMRARKIIDNNAKNIRNEIRWNK